MMKYRCRLINSFTFDLHQDTIRPLIMFWYINITNSDTEGTSAFTALQKAFWPQSYSTSLSLRPALSSTTTPLAFKPLIFPFPAVKSLRCCQRQGIWGSHPLLPVNRVAALTCSYKRKCCHKSNVCCDSTGGEWQSNNSHQGSPLHCNM